MVLLIISSELILHQFIPNPTRPCTQSQRQSRDVNIPTQRHQVVVIQPFILSTAFLSCLLIISSIQTPEHRILIPQEKSIVIDYRTHKGLATQYHSSSQQVIGLPHYHQRLSPLDFRIEWTQNLSHSHQPTWKDDDWKQQ